MKKLSIIIPAFNEEKTILTVLNGVRQTMKKTKTPYEIVVINDGSTDSTKALLAKEKDILLLNHPYKKGYGASLKDGINHSQGDFVLFIDADGQQDSEDILALLKYANDYDMVVGARMNFNSFSRNFAKKILLIFANYLADFKIPDLNSGFRLVKKEIAQNYFFILPNGFSFSSTITLAMIKDSYSLKYVPIKERKRTNGKSTIHPIKDTSRFFMIIIRLSVLFSPSKIFLPPSLVLFLIGLASLIFDIQHNNITDSTILVLLSSILIFFFGLLADQISAIRRQIR